MVSVLATCCWLSYEPDTPLVEKGGGVCRTMAELEVLDAAVS